MTSAAIVAIDSAAIMHWLMPTMIVERAIGNCTRRSNWPPVTPSERDASIVPGATVRMPCAVTRITGGSA